MLLGGWHQPIDPAKGFLPATGRITHFATPPASRHVRVDTGVEQGDVQERQVENLIDEVWLMDKENRRNILSALSGLVRSWHQAGRPTASSFGYKPRLGFERWGEIVGGILTLAMNVSA